MNPVLLFGGGDAFFQEVFQTMMVYFDDKMMINEVGTPMLNGMYDCKHLFS